MTPIEHDLADAADTIRRLRQKLATLTTAVAMVLLSKGKDHGALRRLKAALEEATE